MKTFLLLMVLFASLVLSAQKENRYVVKGNELYAAEKYEEATQAYDQALEFNSGSYKARFNRADALFRQKKYEESAAQFGTLAEEASDKALKAEAYHNLGNAYLMENGKEGNLEKSIDAYKNALRNNPKDEGTRYNLAFAQKLLKQQEQQKDQQEQQKDQQEQQKDQQEQQKDQQEQQKDQQEKEKDQQQKEKNQQQKEKNQQEQQAQKMSKEDAKRMLEAMQNEERKIHERANIKKSDAQRVTIEKDW